MSTTEAVVVKVGIADVKIARFPDTIRTSGLGSCVGLVLYDKEKQTAGLVHVMLPDSTLSKTAELNRAKYADTAVKTTIDMLIEAGCRKFALKAKLAGGSTASSGWPVGPRRWRGPRPSACSPERPQCRARLVGGASSPRRWPRRSCSVGSSLSKSARSRS